MGEVDEGGREQSTSHTSKTVMMRAESTDTIHVDTLGDCEVIQRDMTYFGPKLYIESNDGENFILYAPGPRSELQLTDLKKNPVRKVTAELVDVKKYDICPYCNEPIKGVHHRTRTLIGNCGVDV